MKAKCKETLVYRYMPGLKNHKAQDHLLVIRELCKKYIFRAILCRHSTRHSVAERQILRRKIMNITTALVSLTK